MSPTSTATTRRRAWRPVAENVTAIGIATVVRVAAAEEAAEDAVAEAADVTMAAAVVVGTDTVATVVGMAEADTRGRC